MPSPLPWRHWLTSLHWLLLLLLMLGDSVFQSLTAFLLRQSNSFAQKLRVVFISSLPVWFYPEVNCRLGALPFAQQMADSFTIFSQARTQISYRPVTPYSVDSLLFSPQGGRHFDLSPLAVQCTMRSDCTWVNINRKCNAFNRRGNSVRKGIVLFSWRLL